MDKAAITGNYADFKLIKTRSCVQMVIEIPVEQAQEVIKAFGVPQPGREIAVAVARLAPHEASPIPKTSAQERDKPKSLKSFAGQAKMLAQDVDFRKFIVRDSEQIRIADGDMAEKLIELHCGVSSCSEIIGGTEAGHAFKQLQAEFLRWRDTPPDSVYDDVYMAG